MSLSDSTQDMLTKLWLAVQVVRSETDELQEILTQCQHRQQQSMVDALLRRAIGNQIPSLHQRDRLSSRSLLKQQLRRGDRLQRASRKRCLYRSKSPLAPCWRSREARANLNQSPLSQWSHSPQPLEAAMSRSGCSSDRSKGSKGDSSESSSSKSSSRSRRRPSFSRSRRKQRSLSLNRSRRPRRGRCRRRALSLAPPRLHRAR
mmetsp:Transcript_24297/g.56420  ORF Transcript_24297/g.56420 Transcript_24297/m.56420 type:complete len:204 (-) Transcript_24297:663-1274(-)